MQIFWTIFDNLEATFFSAFWQNAQVIIMITHFFENGKVRKHTELELFFKGDILWYG